MHVFQLLLRHRTTELDAQSDDGTTPLIYAARFMVHDMVDELIKAGAKVNLSDKQGMQLASVFFNCCDEISTLSSCFRQDSFALGCFCR